MIEGRYFADNLLMIALLAAVERFVRLDHDAEWRVCEGRLDVIANAIKGIPTVECERIVPAIANHGVQGRTRTTRR